MSAAVLSKIPRHNSHEPFSKFRRCDRSNCEVCEKFVEWCRLSGQLPRLCGEKNSLTGNCGGGPHKLQRIADWLDRQAEDGFAPSFYHFWIPKYNRWRRTISHRRRNYSPVRTSSIRAARSTMTLGTSCEGLLFGAPVDLLLRLRREDRVTVAKRAMTEMRFI